MYGPAHRLFLQVMMQRRIMDEEEAVKLMRSCCAEFRENVPKLQAFMQEVNKELKSIELALRSTVEEREDSDYPCLVLVNLMAGELTRALTSYSQAELSFMRLLVGEIVTSAEGELRMNEAINLGLSLQPKMKASVCENLIDLLTKEKWLLKSEGRGGTCVALSSLTVAELNTYLEEVYPDNILKCFFCTKVSLKGFRCKQCGIAVHRDCAKKYWANTKKDNTCPNDECSALLSPTPPAASQSKRSRLRRANDEEEEDEEEEEEEEEQEMQDQDQVKEGRQNQKHNHSQEKDLDEEEEEEENLQAAVRRRAKGRRQGTGRLMDRGEGTGEEKSPNRTRSRRYYVMQN